MSGYDAERARRTAHEARLCAEERAARIAEIDDMIGGHTADAERAERESSDIIRIDFERRLELAHKIISDPALAHETSCCDDMPASRFAELCCRVALAEHRGEIAARKEANAYR